MTVVIAWYTLDGLADTGPASGVSYEFVHRTGRRMRGFRRRYVLPKHRIAAGVCQLLLVLPLNLAAILLDFLLPKRYEYYSNNLVLA